MELDNLIEKFKAKDIKAFEQLYSMYSESMHGVIYNIVRDHDIAEEVMQDVFVKIWRKSDTYFTKNSSNKTHSIYFVTQQYSHFRNPGLTRLQKEKFTKYGL